MFEQVARELRAKVMIDSQNWATCSNPRPGRGAGGRRQGLAGQRVDAPSEARSADGSRAGRRPRAHYAARPKTTGTRHLEHQRHHEATTHSNTHQRVGCLAAPHPSSTPGLSTAVNQPQSIIQHSLRCQRLRGADLRGPAAWQPGRDERGHDGHDAHADQL